MNHAEKDIELIEKYYDEGLSGQESEAFERRLHTDDAFRTLVEQEKYIVSAIRMQGLADELAELKRIEAKLADPHYEVRHYGNRRWYILSAAVIALLIVARFALSPGVTTEQLFKDHFRPYPNVFEPTLRSTEPGGDRAEAFKAYEKGDYARAATLFRGQLEHGYDAGMLLLLGNSNLMIGRTDEAIINFSTLTARSPELSVQATWFLSMAYLKRDDTSHAVRLLKELSTTDASYAEKADEILKQLK